MGFLLGLEHASLTKVSPSCCSKNADINRPTVSKNLDKLQTDHLKNVSGNKTRSEDIKNTKEQFYDDFQIDEKSNEIRQCLKRTLSSLSTKWHPSGKLSLVKINKATSEIITGVKYTVDFDTRDEMTGKSYSTEAIIVSHPWSSQDSAIVDFRCTPRASI